MSTNEIESLKRKEEELIARLADVRQLLHAAQCEAAGVNRGDVVLDSRGRRFKVSKVENFWSHSKPSISGFKELKGGGYQCRAQYIGNEWEKA